MNLSTYSTETQFLEKKSLKVVTGKNADWGELAKDCVCLANAKGGIIAIGIEDDSAEPPADQKISVNLSIKIISLSNKAINRLLDRQELFLSKTLMQYAFTKFAA
jgi:predicted HTH transcriptional regulator